MRKTEQPCSVNKGASYRITAGHHRPVLSCWNSQLPPGCMVNRGADHHVKDMSKHTGGPNVGQNSWKPNSFYLKWYCHFVIIDDEKKKCLFFILAIVTHMSGTYGSYLTFRNENEALTVYHQVLAVYHTIFTTFFFQYLFILWLIDLQVKVFWK